MSRFLGLFLLSTFGVVQATQAADPPSKNLTTIVVADGPFAGTYTADNTACLTVKARDTFGSGWKAFSNHPKTKTLEEAGIQADRVNAEGGKTGSIVVKFADGVSDKLVDYSLSNVPVTLKRNGTGGQLTFDGKTKDGVRLKISANCVEVEAF